MSTIHYKYGDGIHFEINTPDGIKKMYDDEALSYMTSLYLL